MRCLIAYLAMLSFPESSLVVFVFFFKQKTAYEMRISDWSSDVCSSDLHAKTDCLFDQFREAQEQCKELLTAKLPLPAYDHAIKASHLFNLLNARGVISVAERQAYIARVRELAKGCCEGWMEKNGWQS